MSRKLVILMVESEYAESVHKTDSNTKEKDTPRKEKHC